METEGEGAKDSSMFCLMFCDAHFANNRTCCRDKKESTKVGGETGKTANLKANKSEIALEKEVVRNKSTRKFATRTK